MAKARGTKWSVVARERGSRIGAALSLLLFAAAAHAAPELGVSAGMVEMEIDGLRLEIREGFTVEKVYQVPRDEQGSWVALTVDDRGRLIASDQKGKLYRLDGVGKGELAEAEAIEAEIGFAHGLLHSQGNLYAVVSGNADGDSGLFRIRDTDGDDRYDTVEEMRRFHGRGEHGPHSVVEGPRGEWLYVVAGNKTAPLEGEEVRWLVPEHWGEDDLLPRIWGPIGSERGTTAPGGWVARTDREGKQWEVLAIGLRNAFDLAFNEEGEPFVTDADAEFDMGTPWYQPTRLLHIAPGIDYGWRSGSGKWPSYYEDTLPPVYEYGPGSPTGIAFGYGADFPERYRKALFACDWSWGRIFVSWLARDGYSYKAETEEFMRGVPLPVADVFVNPCDGCLYFTLGGRGVSSAVYRIRHLGAEGEDSAIEPRKEPAMEAREARQDLEFPIGADPQEKLKAAWMRLDHEDAVARHSARMALERTETKLWQERALAEENRRKRLVALLALSRAGGGELREEMAAAFYSLDWKDLDRETLLLAARALEVFLIRMGKPEGGDQLVAQLDKLFPTGDWRANRELAKLLVFLGSAEVTDEAMELIERAATQEDKLAYLLPLRYQELGWTDALRVRYFQELGRAQRWKGGLSLSKYIEAIADDALDTLGEKGRARYAALARPVVAAGENVAPAERTFVRDWTVDELLPISEKVWQDRDAERGREHFAAAGCYACHRVGSEGGGLGPDLTAATRRFGTRDLLEAIIEPSRVVSDQYGWAVIRKQDGTEVIGRIVNFYGDSVGVQSDALNAAEVLRIPREQIRDIEVGEVSPMPGGLLNTLEREEILDLLEFLKEAAK